MNIKNKIINYMVEDVKNSMERFALKMKRDQEHTSRWVEKFKIRYENNLDTIIEKLLTKYYSEEYMEREHKIGVQPRDPFLWLLWEYAQTYCRECEDKKYFNEFTGGAFYVGSYVIQVMYGQGATLKLTSTKEE